eukprot:TRINITY_DN43657_c0_g1_i1.p1 TRINITY_DN43657_c0_g1~~TRINITY_DN43657_c0_g1_i1.p1  ORF type:complete len:750 (+),score=187.05 TRINITY_DN43657_c0_g1_i1:57-2252(+)
MSFTVFAAADLWGNKLNYELSFPSKPSPAEVLQRAAAVFGAESALRRPSTVPPAHAFQIDRLQTFDEVGQRWVDLMSPQQLQEGSQVYVFQKETQYHREQQSKIPAPVPLVHSPYQQPYAVSSPARPMAGVPPGPAISAASGPTSIAMLRASSATAMRSVTLPATQTVTAAPAPPPPPPPGATSPLPPPGPSRAAALSATHPSTAGRPHGPMVPSTVPVPADPPSARADLTSDRSTQPGMLPSPRQQTAVVDVPHQDKVKGVFTFLAGPGRAGFDLDDFRAALSKLRCDFASGGSAADLFVRADTDRDNVVRDAEWTKFCESYPALLDALYFRSVDCEAEARLERTMDEARAALARCREQQQEVRMAVINATAQTSEHEQRLIGCDGAIQAAHARQDEARGLLTAAKDGTERCREEVRVCVTALGVARDDERKHSVAAQESSRQVELARRGLAQQQQVERQQADEILALERRLEELRGGLAEAQAAVDSAHHAVASAEAEEQVAAELLRERQRGVQQQQVRVGTAEDEVAAAIVRQQHADQCLRDAEAQCRSEELNRRRCEEELVVSRTREAQQRAREQEAAQASESQEQALQQLDRERMELNLRRRQQEEEERPLLDQERRLREQRDLLEEEEKRLRSDHRSFHTAYGRGTPAADAGGLSPSLTATPAPRRSATPVRASVGAVKSVQSPGACSAAVRHASPPQRVCPSPVGFVYLPVRSPTVDARSLSPK